jgi:hypothetical protein
MRQDYISKDTWNLIGERYRKLKGGDSAKEVNKLSRMIKHTSHENRKQKKLEEFNEKPADKHKRGLWKAVKNSEFDPAIHPHEKSHGQTSLSLKNRSEVIADYLEKHWCNSAADGLPRRIPHDNIREQVNKEGQWLPSVHWNWKKRSHLLRKEKN